MNIIFIPECSNLNINLVLQIQGPAGPEHENVLRSTLQNDHANIDDLIHRFSGLSLYDSSIGSVIIHLRTSQTDGNALEMIQKSFVNGNLRKMISAILEKSGILEDAVVHVTVKIERKESTGDY